MSINALRAPFGLLLLAAALAVPSVALASGARVGVASLHATAFANAAYGPGAVSGHATLTTNGGTDTTSIVVRVEGLRPGTTHIGHLHFGDEANPCDRLQPGAIIEDLGPLTANAHGVAVARTVIDTPTDGVADCEWWVAVHEGPENISPQTPAIAIGPVEFRGTGQ